MPRLRESVVSNWRRALRVWFWVLLVATPLGAQEDCADEWRIRRLDGVPGTTPGSGARTAIDVDAAAVQAV